MASIKARLGAALCGVLFLTPCELSAGGKTTVAIGPGAENGSYRVAGEFQVDASASVAWQVLTDYDGIGDFVSSIRSSRVVRRDKGGPLVEQEATGSFLFFSRKIKLLLTVREEPPTRLDFKDVEGLQFKRYEGSWRITPSSGGCRVAYELTAQPDASLGPRFIAKAALKNTARKLLDEVRAEIERRAREARDG